MDDISRLQEENQKLNARLEALNEKLEKSEGYKSYFISLITNEIINPFTSILGLSKAITQLGGNDMNKAKELAQIIYSEAFFLDFQLNNIFMAARLEAGEAVANPVKVDVVSVLKQVLDEFKPEAEKKSLELLLENDDNPALSVFVVDPVIIKIVVSNLVSNAIKASDPENRVVVYAGVEEGILNITVQDFGVGIEQQKIHELFDRFKRLDETINSINTGSGIGLPVVTGVLDLLHGKLDVESEPGKGSIFRVTVPEAIRTDCGFAADDDELFFDMDDEAESF